MLPNRKHFRKLSICAAISAACGAQHTFGQESEPETKLEEVVITGSRIARSNFELASPVYNIGSDIIDRAGTPDLGTILASAPAIGATDTLQGNVGSNALAGISSADLRRLGTNRTLVLVDGKRHIGGVAGSNQVDLNTIPVGLIENIEILTGGASAVYGSDAVSGVVNFTLKKDFTGLQLNASASDSTEGVGSNNHNFNIIAGADVADGRGNITFYGDITRISEVVSNDLQHLDNWGTVANPLDTGEEDGIADRLRVRNVLSEFISYTGVLNPFSGAPERWTFDESGNPVVQTERDLTNSFAFGNFPDGCEFCFGTEDYENILPGLERFNIATRFNYEINDSINFFADAKFVRADIVQQFQPSFRFGNVSINVEDNPYLDETLREEMLAADVTNATFAKFFDELGNRSADNRRETARIVTGFDGNFILADTDFIYEVFYINSETSNQRNTLNDLIPDNLVAALDAVVDPDTGEIACRSQVASLQPDGYVDPAAFNGENCVPYNPFGFQQASEEARDWVSADVQRSDIMTQELFGGFISFDTSAFFSLPAGAPSIAMGFESREENSETITDEFTQRGFLTSAATPDASGSFTVDEYFAEASLPILSDLPGAQSLVLDLAYRAADYDPFGSVSSSKVGLIYKPIDSLSLRATWGDAVRAPNIEEAFSPQSPSFAQINDPCDSDNIDDDDDRRANCAALGIPDGFEANDNVSIDILVGGNPDLIPEESTSLTYGVVWTPSFIDGLAVSIDYYDIEIEDAIIQVTAQQILDNCVDATGGPDSTFCSLIERSADTQDVDLVTTGFLNAAALTTEGIDLEAQYSTSLESFGLPGNASATLNMNYLLELDFFEFQTRPDEINVEVGEEGDPEWQLGLRTNYTLNDFRVDWAVRYIDRVVTYDVSPNGGSSEDLAPGHIPSVTTHDLSFSYNLTESATVTLGAINVFNRLPPPYTVDPIYDSLGRRVFARASINF